MIPEWILYVNMVLAGIGACWLPFVAYARWRTRDPFGGIWYALGAELVCISYSAGIASRYHSNTLIAPTYYTLGFTLGFTCFLIGQCFVILAGHGRLRATEPTEVRNDVD